MKKLINTFYDNNYSWNNVMKKWSGLQKQKPYIPRADWGFYADIAAEIGADENSS